MRKIVATEMVSVDGVMQSPENWAFRFHDEEMAEAQGGGMSGADAMLMGRVTYQEFASYWPFQDSAEQPYTDYLNNIPKYVVSTTLREPLEWQNSILVRGNVAQEVAELKRRPGKDIGIVGAGTLVRSLLGEGLIDELHLMVHPIVLGGGKRLFEETGDRMDLELVRSRAFATGVVHLIYAPAGG